MLQCCGRSWFQHACPSCVSAKALQGLPASSSGCSEMEISKCLGLTETLPEVQALQFQQLNASRKLLSEMQSKTCHTPTPGSNSAWKTEQWVDPEQRKQAGFTYCQSSCAVLLGWPAQSDQPLWSWPQIHSGFCLQSSPPSRWCSRCSLVGRFAGAPLKWEKMLVNGQVWKRENLMLDNLSLKISPLPGILDLHQVFLSNLPPNLSSSALIQWLVSIQAQIFSLLTVREEKVRKKNHIWSKEKGKSPAQSLS